MAHPCFYCGTECYCHGSIDDTITDKTPKNCDSCGCVGDGDDEDRGYIICPYCGLEWDEIDIEYQMCSTCDYHA